MKILPFSALLVALSAGCVDGQVATLDSQLRAKLEVGSAEQIRTETLTFSCWPRVEFVRARLAQLVGGEDPRPVLVAATISPNDTVISTGWEDVPSIWRKIGGSSGILTRPDSQVVTCLLQLLDGSAALPSPRLLMSAEQAIGSNLTWSRQDSVQLQKVGPPALRRVADAVTLTLFSREKGGIFRVQISIAPNRDLTLRRDALARTVLNY